MNPFGLGDDFDDEPNEDEDDDDFDQDDDKDEDPDDEDDEGETWQVVDEGARPKRQLSLDFRLRTA